MLFFCQTHPYIFSLFFFGAGLLGVAGNNPASHEEAAAVACIINAVSPWIAEKLEHNYIVFYIYIRIYIWVCAVLCCVCASAENVVQNALYVSRLPLCTFLSVLRCGQCLPHRDPHRKKEIS